LRRGAPAGPVVRGRSTEGPARSCPSWHRPHAGNATRRSAGAGSRIGLG